MVRSTNFKTKMYFPFIYVSIVSIITALFNHVWLVDYKPYTITTVLIVNFCLSKVVDRVVDEKKLF